MLSFPSSSSIIFSQERTLESFFSLCSKILVSPSSLRLLNWFLQAFLQGSFFYIPLHVLQFIKVTMLSWRNKVEFQRVGLFCTVLVFSSHVFFMIRLKCGLLFGTHVTYPNDICHEIAYIDSESTYEALQVCQFRIIHDYHGHIMF